MKKPISIKRYQELYNETAKLRVLYTLFTFPDKEFSLSDLAKEARVAKSNIGKILEEFYTVGLVDISKLNVIWRIKANNLNPPFIRLKIPHNLFLIYNSGVIELLNECFGNIKAIILFGSFRKGDDITDSDIDIAVETDSAQGYNVTNFEKLAKNKDMIMKIQELQKTLKRNIQIHIFKRNNVDINVFNNIANGIVLDGFLEVKP